jgi:hypothetical protein
MAYILPALFVAEEAAARWKKGHAEMKALKKALKAVYKDGPKPDDADKGDKSDAAMKAASARKEAAIKKAVGTKQPAVNTKSGLDSDKAGQTGRLASVSKMSDKEWEELSDDKRRDLRGDNI